MTNPSGGGRKAGAHRAHLRYGRSVAAGLLALALVAGCSSEEEQFATFMEQGASYADQEKWEEAVIEYRNALQLSPNSAEAHHALAKAYLQSGRIREAYWELHETGRLDPTNVEAQLAYGELSLAAKESQPALDAADGILAVEPENTIAMALKGRALEQLGRSDEAEEPYRRALELAEEKTPYSLMLAGYHQRRGQIDEAEVLLQALIEQDPGFRSYTSLGRLLASDRRRADDAEAAFKSALVAAEGEDLKTGYRNLAGLYFNLGREAEAVATLEEGVQKVDDKLELIYLLARFHSAAGDVAKADKLVEDATAAEPDNPAPFLILSAYRGRKGDVQGAIEAADQAIALDPESKAARLRKAELLVDLGYREGDELKVSEGRSIVDSVLLKEPTYPAALFVRAKVEMARGENEAAMASLRGAIDGRPDWAQAHFVLASALLLDGDATGARSELARAIELDAGLLEARRLLTQVHAALGEHEYAIEQGRLYLREKPDHTPTRIAVAQSLVRLGRADQALADLEEIPPEQETPDVLYAKARLLAAKGDFEKSRSLLVRANDGRPNQPDILRTLLGVESRLGEVDTAVERIREAVQAEPEIARLHVLNGLVRLRDRDLNGAESEFRRAIDLDPDDLWAYEQLAFLYQRTGKGDKMIATYEEASAAQPDNARLHHLLGVLYEMSGDQPKAVESYEKAIGLDAQMGEPRNNLAYLLAEEGENLDRALDLAQEAKALLPQSANAADTLGWVLYKRGVSSAAVGYLQEAEANMDPSESGLGVVRHHLALAYEANGEADKAVEVLERAIATAERQLEQVRARGGEPTDPPWLADVRGMLERLQSAQG
ncbi:MAG: tetratricopeptide repeat protein [Myxococcota bacterium]